MKNKNVPHRMCVACRSKKQKNLMLRVVRFENNVSIDFTGKAEGRGAYICDDPSCLKKCVRSRLFNKAFKSQISEELYAKIVSEYEDRQKNGQ